MTGAHPADREMLPDDPLELSAIEVTGDVELMFRLLVEEYARMGYDTGAILRLARNPFYAGFHRFHIAYGEQGLRSSIEAVIARCGVTRVSDGGKAEGRSTSCRP